MTTLRMLLRVTVIALAAYLAFALLVVTPALNFLPQRYIQETYGWELRTAWVLFNPLQVSLDVRGAELHDAAGERFLAFSDASVDLSLESLWQPGWVLDRVYLRDLSLQLQRLRPGEYNFSDLLPGDTSGAPAQDRSAAVPRITLRDVDLHTANLVATDRARETPWTSRWHDLHIRLTDVSTVFEEQRPFSVEVEAEGGGTLRWHGDLSVAQGHSAGRVSLADFDLVNLWEFARPWVAFELKAGRLAAEADYELNWKDALEYRIKGARVTLSALDIAPKDPMQLPDTRVALKSMAVGPIAADSTARNVAVDSITLESPVVATYLEDNRVSLQSLFAVALPDAPAPPEPEATTWTLTLNKAQLRDGSLQWRSPYTDPQQLVVQPIDAALEHVTWPLSGDSRLSLNLSVNQQTQIAANGTLALASGSGNVEYTLEGLPLTWFNPNLPQPLKLTIAGGQIGLKGTAALEDFTPTIVALDVNVRDFSARQADEEIALTRFELLHLAGVTIDMTQHTLGLRKIAVDTYTGRLHIHKDGSINTSRIWKEEVGEQAQQIAEDLTESKPWRFSLPLIEISDSAIDFMDESLPIQFRTVIGDLQGEVRNLGSEASTVATVDLTGSVDGYAPVALKGDISPMASPADLDLRLTFDGVDMALLSPYSGTYAGYKIDRGLLDLDLHYSLRNNQLQGENSVRIEKLKLGEKIASDKAVDLPLQLALAILTDANGVIDLAVPVKGEVDNPQFDIGSVISKAFLNLITKAITAPFSLLAGLAKSDDDLQRITFSSGSSTLNEGNKEKLRQLATALVQRPKLSLVITGRLNLTADRERLQRDALKARLLADGLPAEEIKSRGDDWEEAIAALYEALPASDSATVELSAREQSVVVAQSIAIADTQLTELAGQRAVAVKLFLVTEAALAPERAVVGQPSLKENENTFSGVELGIGQ